MGTMFLNFEKLGKSGWKTDGETPGRSLRLPGESIYDGYEDPRNSLHSFTLSGLES
jgi:hypothetical protein